MHIPRFVQGHEKTKTKRELAGQFESDKVVEDESVNESLSISETKAQHLERNPPLAGKCSIGSDELLFLRSVLQMVHINTPFIMMYRLPSKVSLMHFFRHFQTISIVSKKLNIQSIYSAEYV